MATTSTSPGRGATYGPHLRPRRKIPNWLRNMLRNPLSITGLVIILLMAIVALLAPVLAPPSIPSQPYLIPRDGFEATPRSPGPGEPLGTTEGQYDLYYGVVWGTRTAFQVGLIVTIATVLFGGAIGAISGFVGGALDNVLQRITELFLAFPFLLAAITLATVLGPKIRNGLITGMIALTVFGWPTYTRLIRGDVLSVRERDYVLAARAIGASGSRVLVRHVLPNSFYSLLVVASLNVGANVLTFAALSFLGLGAPVGYADWGQLLSFARNWIPVLFTYWWIVVYPGVALLLFSLAWNLIGDTFRDALDPQQQRIGA
jgi:peptide/nickel transport system permease protein